MPIEHVYPAFLVIAAIMAAGARFARWSNFYSDMIQPRHGAHYVCLDGLRGFLAVGVLVHHGVLTYLHLGTGRWDASAYPTYQLFGHVAVSMFFMITGFLFWGKVLDKQGNIHWGNYVRARFARVTPMYLVVATAAVLIALATVNPATLSTSGIAKAIGSMYSLGAIPWQKLGDVKTGRIVAGVIWTLKYEWVFYAALPMMASFRRPRWLVGLLLAYLAYSVLSGDSFRTGPGPAIYLIGGMIAARLIRSPFLKNLRWDSQPISIGVLLCFVLMPWMLRANLAVLIVPLTFTAFFAIANGNTMWGVLTLSGPRMLGTVSYSVYLVHGIVLYLSRPWLAEIADAGSLPLFWLAIAAIGVVILLISAVTFRWIEHPFMIKPAARPTADRAPQPGFAAMPT